MAWKQLTLLTAKPVLFVCNVEEENAGEGNAHSKAVAEMAEAQGAASVVISAAIEEEISQLDADEAEMFLNELGLEEAGLESLDRRWVRIVGIANLFHGWPQRDPRMDNQERNISPPSGRCYSHGF